jgi:hypothetical protein
MARNVENICGLPSTSHSSFCFPYKSFFGLLIYGKAGPIFGDSCENGVGGYIWHASPDVRAEDLYLLTCKDFVWLPPIRHKYWQWIPRFSFRWRTQRNAIIIANCRIQWIIELLNANGADWLFLSAHIFQCHFISNTNTFLRTGGRVQKWKSWRNCMFKSELSSTFFGKLLFWRGLERVLGGWAGIIAFWRHSDMHEHKSF